MKKSKYKISFYGHNCFLIESDDSFLLIDPWLTDAGAFLGSWFQYPENHKFQNFAVELTSRKKGFVYLTHEHEDHFDSDTLCKFSNQTTVIIPDFRDKFLRAKIQQLGLSIVELKDSEKFKITEDFIVQPFVSDVGINHDSAVLVITKDFNFLNQNDCKIFDRLDQINCKIDYYSVQFSGATSHPVSYANYSNAEKISISKRKVDAKLRNVVDAIKLLRPKIYIPAAGPAVFPFLDHNLSLGIGNIFIHQNELQKILAQHDIHNIFYARPGDLIDDRVTSPIPSPTKQELEEYAGRVICKWDAIPDNFEESKLLENINQRLDAIWDLDFDCEFILCLKWGDADSDAVYIDLDAKQVIDYRIADISRLYTVHSDPKYFALMCTNARWQDISLSLRARLKRVPDIFNNFINLFLYSDIDNIRDAFIDTLTIPKERIRVVGADGVIYEVNRYCPHQGADLASAVINENNQLVCPRHSWCFSLMDSGKCTSNNSSILSLVFKK